MQARLAAWLTTTAWRLRREDGQAMVEYTILLAIITVATVVTIGLVGGWVSARWSDLQAALGL